MPWTTSDQVFESNFHVIWLEEVSGVGGPVSPRVTPSTHSNRVYNTDCVPVGQFDKEVLQYMYIYTACSYALVLSMAVIGLELKPLASRRNICFFDK